MRPEPKWWARARRMVKDGYKIIEIARFFSKSEWAVRYALSPEIRETTKIRNAAYHPRRKSQTGRVYDYKRQYLRKAARQEHLETGENLEAIYRRFDCL